MVGAGSHRPVRVSSIRELGQPPLLTEPLQPGDVLLALGKSDLSEGIRVATDGRYSHAALWTGESVIEASLPGVQELSPHEFAGKQRYIDAYRYRASASQRLQVVEKARAYCSVYEYSKMDLVLMSSLQTLTLWLNDAWVAYNVSYWSGTVRQLFSSRRARQLYNELQTRFSRAKRGSLTCVELAIRAYLDSGLRITIRIDPSGQFDFESLTKAVRSLYALNQAAGLEEPRVTQLLAMDSDYLALQDELEWFHELETRLRSTEDPRLKEEDYQLTVAEIQAMRMVAGEQFSAALVTPKQLENSPEFCCLGRLDATQWARGNVADGMGKA